MDGWMDGGMDGGMHACSLFILFLCVYSYYVYTHQLASMYGSMDGHP